MISILPAWLHARRRGISVPLIDLMGMSLRRSPSGKIIDAAALARDHQLDIPMYSIEVHYLAGGDSILCIEAVIEAKRRGLEGDWDHATAIDLAGRDPLAVARAGVPLNAVVGRREYSDRFRKQQSL